VKLPWFAGIDEAFFGHPVSFHFGIMFSVKCASPGAPAKRIQHQFVSSRFFVRTRSE
jgi:hypothetical protein